MKKIILTLLALTTFSFADEQLDMLRAMKVADYIENEYNMISRTDAYILKTADLTPTRGEIQNFFGLGEEFWDNFEKERCSLSGGLCVGNVGTGVNLLVNNTAKTFTLSNTLGATPNSYVVEAYANDDDNTRTVDAGNNVTFPFTTKAANLVDLVTELSADPDAYIGATAPADTSKIWYQPDGNGGLTIKKYNTATGNWDRVGQTGSGGQGKVYATDEDELNTIPCLAGDTGYVASSSATEAMEYTCIADGTWKQVAGGGTGGGLFNGEATIEAIVKQLMDKDGGSVATASAPNGEFVGVKDFTKKSAVGSNGYWVAENIYVATDVMTSLLTQNWSLNAYAWLPNSNGGVYSLQKRTVPGNGDHWVYLANGYDDVAANFNNIENNDGGWVYDTKNSKYFKKSNNVWTDVTNTIKLTAGSLGRGEFITLNSAITYYVGGNDCDTSTCNGVGGTYAGVTHDNMYVFYYSTSGNRKNNLIDAIPRASMTEIYNNADAASLYNGYVFLKDVDNRGRLCYKRTSDSKYVTKSNVVIPTTNNMPPADAGSCSNATYSGSAIVLTNRTEMTNWTDAPLSAQVYTASKTYTFTNGTGNDHYWKSTTEWVTNGSRSDFDVATSSSIVYLSKQVGSEPNYTDTGVTASVDSSFKQWFYSLTGTVTNRLLDAVPCNANYASEQMDDLCFDKVVFITLDNVVKTPNQAKNELNKYCNFYYNDDFNEHRGNAWLIDSRMYYINGYAFDGQTAYIRDNNTNQTIVSYPAHNGMAISAYNSNGLTRTSFSWVTNNNNVESASNRNASYSCNSTGSGVWYK